ncbi:TetR family transcriptional regulator [Oscillospiraceae bacterium PP1C4]
MNQNDLRVIKTRKNIQTALIILLQKKNFSKITVQDILNQAMINRTTFYKHYQDKYQLVEIMCNEIFQIAKAGIEERFQCTATNDLIQCVKELYQKLLSEKELILALFCIHTETIHLYEDMIILLRQMFCQFYLRKHQNDEMMADYFSSLYASMVMTTINWCLIKDKGFEELEKNSDFFIKLQELI